MLKSALIILYRQIADRTLKFKLLLFISAVFLIALVELAGIGILVPFVAGIINGHDQITVLNLNFTIDNYLVLYIACFWVIKAACIIIANFYTALFIQDLKSRLQSALLKKFLSRTNRNIGSETGDLFTRITNDIQMITGQILTPFSVAISETILIFILLIILFKIYPTGLILLILSVVTAFIVNHLTVAKISFVVGEKRKELENKWAIKLTGALFSRFEAVTYKVEEKLHSEISGFIKHSNREAGKFYSLHPITRSLLEISAIIGIILAMAYGKQSDLSAEILMLFLVGSIRMLPGAVKIGYAISSIKFASSVLVQISALLSTSKTYDQVDLILSDNSILLRNLASKSPTDCIINTPGSGLTIVCGPSGVGKSTWLSSVALQLAQKNLRVGLVMQESAVISSDLYSNITFYREDVDKKKIYEILTRLKINNQAIENIDDLNSLSGGEKRRLMLARATACEPGFLLLDEPTAGLDRQTQIDVMEYIKEISVDCNVIMISHSKIDAEYADAIFQMEDIKNA